MMAPSIARRDGARNGLLEARRSARWQKSVKVDPLLRIMARAKATISFKTRKMTVTAQIEFAIWTGLSLNGWTLKDKYLGIVKNVAETCTGHCYEINFRRLFRAMVYSGASVIAAGTFANWILRHAHILEASRFEVKPREAKALPALRLHVVGRGKVGKNFPPTFQRLRRSQQSKSLVLASKLCHAVAPQSASLLPAFLVRAASQVQPPATVFASEAKKAQQPGPCHFLELPAELRNIIYDYVLSPDSDLDSSDEIDLLTASCPLPALPQTCKQIGEECGLMYVKNFRHFWRESHFYIDASAFLTGWHVRPAIHRLPEREIQKITNLRIAVVAKNGVYNATMKEGYWLVQRVGGPDPSGRGASGRRIWGADEIATVFRREKQDDIDGYPRPQGQDTDYDFRLGPLSGPVSRAYHRTRLWGMLREKMQIRGQIVAIIEKLHRWI